MFGLHRLDCGIDGIFGSLTLWPDRHKLLLFKFVAPLGSSGIRVGNKRNFKGSKNVKQLRPPAINLLDRIVKIEDSLFKQ